MIELYPLKFRPIPQYRIWGGNKLNQVLPKENQMENLGEIWTLSGVSGHVSIVENGALAGKNLNEVITLFAENLMGKRIWNKYKTDFPLLIKFIDAAEPLSVQVHPGDLQAKRLHNSYGKSEMWYIIEADKDAELIIGFDNGITKQDFIASLKNETLEEILHKVPVSGGDAVYIPAGRVHAIGKGIVLAEIQQTSDITYRIYDYNRIDKDGQKRELHTDLALEAIDFHEIDKIKTDYTKMTNSFSYLIKSPYFSTRVFEGEHSCQINTNDEFLIYICTEGNAIFTTDKSKTELKKYECLLMPASISAFEIVPEKNSTLIEVKIP